MSDAPTVRFELEGTLGIVTIANPPLNLFSMQVIAELSEATVQAERASIRALLVRAEGPNFSAGAQVDDVFQGLTAEQAHTRLEEFRALMERTERLPFPTIAAVRGLCLAAGLEAVLALDLIWASQTATFAFAESVIGFTPPAGGPFRLAARAGTGRALESVLTGRPYTAETMANWGVVNRVLPDDDLDAKTLAFARSLAGGPTRAYDAAKQILRTYRDHGAAAAAAISPATCAPLFETDDMMHGIESLLANGPGQARFEGH